jgi:pimeloyl-ACP methyl ester carboxylesterase
MTTFLLVPGMCLGAWVWEAVAADLEGRGHRAVPLTLPGLAERAGPDAGRIGLADHTAAVVELLDEHGPGVVLVAHSYGSFPATAAADQRPDRIARVVYVDTGIPENGESMATSVVGAAIAAAGEDGLIAVPDRLPPGVPESERERYYRLATPHPGATATDPVRLTGAWNKLPTTGVFCLDSGLSRDVARSLHATGDPRFAKLAEPGVTYFELPTGHFPMLSTPAALTDALVRAAAGEGPGLYD